MTQKRSEKINRMEKRKAETLGNVLKQVNLYVGYISRNADYTVSPTSWHQGPLYGKDNFSLDPAGAWRMKDEPKDLKQVMLYCVLYFYYF